MSLMHQQCLTNFCTNLQAESSKTEVNTLNLEVIRLKKLLSTSNEQSDMLASEFQTALESAIEAKSAAVKDMRDAQKKSTKDIEDLKTDNDRIIKAGEIAAIDMQNKYNEELKALLEKQKTLLSDSFKDRIDDLETAVRDSQATAIVKDKSLSAAIEALELQKSNSNTSQNDLTAITSKYEDIQATVLTLTATITDRDEKISKILQDFSAERSLLEHKAEESQLKCLSLTADVEKLQSDFNDLESERKIATSTKTQVEDDIRQERDELKIEMQSLQASMTAQKKDDLEVDMKREESLATTTALLTQNKVQLLSTLTENKEYEERCKLLTDEVENLKKQVVNQEKTQQKSKASEGDLNKANEVQHKLIMERDALILKCEGLEDELNVIQSKQADAYQPVNINTKTEDDESDMELEMDGLKTQILIMQDRLQEKEEQLDAVHRAADASSEDIQRELETLKKALIAKELLERAQSADSSELNENSSEEVTSTARVIELESTVSRQEDEINKLKLSVQEAEAKYQNGVSDLSVLTEEINASVTVVLERDTTVENLITEISTLKQSVKDINSQLESEKITVSESEDSILKLQADYDAIHLKNSSLEKSLEAAVDSKINADKLLQKAMEDCDAARTFAENLMTQSIGEDDNRTGVETALKASLDTAVKAHKEAITSLRSELQQAIEEKVRAENDLEEAFSAKCAGELLLKSDLQVAVKAKESAEASVADALEGKKKAIEELSKSLNNLKREKELSSSSEIRIEEVEANAEMEIITQLSRQSSIISSSFKTQIEEMEVATQALRKSVEVHAKREEEAIEQLHAVTEQRNAIQKDLEIALKANMESAGAAEGDLKTALESKIDVETALKASLDTAAEAHKEAITSLRSELQQAIEEKVRAENDLEEAFSAKCAGEVLLKSDLQVAVKAKESAEASVADALESMRRAEGDLEEAVEGRRRAEGDLEEAVEGRRRAEGDLEEAVEGRRRAEGDLEEAVEGRRCAEGDLEEAVEGRRRAEGDLEEAVEGRRRAEGDLEEAVEGRRRAEGDLEEAVEGRRRAENSLTDALSATAEAQKALRICEEDLKLTDKEANDAEARLINQNRAVANLEDTVQERIVENASLREELGTSRLRYNKLEETFLKSEQVILDLRADLQGNVYDKEIIVATSSKQLETAMDEVEHYTKSLLSKEKELEELTLRFNNTDNELTAIKIRESEYILKLQQSIDAEVRVAEAEEALSRVEEKKKRDLENLKKQNERISAVQVRIVIHFYFLYDV